MTLSPNVPDTPYATRLRPAGDVLLLDRNEGPAPPADLLAAIAAENAETLRRYPDASELEAMLARRLGVTPEEVLLTAGADDAIDRCCRAFLGPGRGLVLAVPTFEMIERFARLTGCDTRRVPWTHAAFPVRAFHAAIDARTGLAAVVSPNNPTGVALDRHTFDRIVTELSPTPLLLDHAYVEYADDDLTDAALAHGNVVVVRTLSKAWGLAGCRVGYAVGPAGLIRTLRAAGAPYPVAGPSLAIASARLRGGGVEPHVTRIRCERRRLTRRLAAAGVSVRPSQANFVLAEFGARAGFVRDALLVSGVLVRDFTGHALLDGALRISLPGMDAAFQRLAAALDLVLRPQALLFDMDGVLVDVSESYRRAIIETAASFGVTVGEREIAEYKARGDANDDWELTHRLLAERGVVQPIAEVTAAFQARYLGGSGAPGLRERERLTVSARWLRKLARRCPLAVVTGRPREEAEWLLDREGVRRCFAAVVAREDGPLKPDPAPVRLALDRLGVARAWMLGDTRDDVRAARAAHVLPIGIGKGTSLRDAGAAWQLTTLDQLETLWI